MENINRIMEKLDVEKWNVYQKGYAFQMITLNIKDDEFRNVGIGDGEEMTLLNLVALDDLYTNGASEEIPFEAFAESVKQNLIMFHRMRLQEVVDSLKEGEEDEP